MEPILWEGSGTRIPGDYRMTGNKDVRVATAGGKFVVARYQWVSMR